MPKISEPWRWEERGGWYAWVKGSRRRLASFGDGIGKAKKRLRELLAEAEAGEASPVPLVGDLVVGYLEHLVGRKAANDIGEQTKADAERRMAGFADRCGDLPADAIRPVHVDEWLATRTGWGPTSRHDGAGAVRAVFRWAMRQGLIDRDPLSAMAKPPRKPKREAIPSAEQVGKAMAAVLAPELRDILDFIHATGCRPKEARTLEARHLDRAAHVAVLTEHKTARKTGTKRRIYLPKPAQDIAYRLADLRPEGPIFLNSAGNPWTHNALGLAMRRVKKRAGVDIVPYDMRHGFATDAITAGVPAALVAEMMGHADLRMLGRYTHLSDKHEALREAVEKVRGGQGES